MNRYDFLIYESRQGEASIEADSPKEARDKLMELYKAGGIEFTFVTGTDNEIRAPRRRTRMCGSSSAPITSRIASYMIPAVPAWAASVARWVVTPPNDGN